MRFIEYLFFKYYNWQVKVGNGCIASFGAICFMTFCIMFYCLDILMFMSYFIGKITIPKYILLVMFLSVLIILYFSLVYHGKNMQIVESHGSVSTSVSEVCRLQGCGAKLDKYFHFNHCF